MGKLPSIRPPWQGEKRAPQEGRKVDNQSGYNSERWRSVSTTRRKTPETMLCEVCAANGKDRYGDCVDHLIPVAEGGDWWDERNHMTMCHGHHNRKSGMEKTCKKLIKTTVNSEGMLIPSNRGDIFEVLLGRGGSQSPQL